MNNNPPMNRPSMPGRTPPPRRKTDLMNWFWIAATGATIVLLHEAKTWDAASMGAALIVEVAALIPAFIWCKKNGADMPIFPIFALTYIWTHALQFMDARALAYPAQSRITAALTVAGFLLIGTFAWRLFVGRAARPPVQLRMLTGSESERYFLWALALGAFFSMNTLGGWINMSGGVFALIRGIVLGLGTLATFVLFYRCGRRQLRRSSTQMMLVLFALLTLSGAVSLILIGSIVMTVLASIGFILGRGRIPWIKILIPLLFLCFLHNGKAEMREQYWLSGSASVRIQPWDYPGFYAEWVQKSFNGFFADPDESDKQRFLERASLAHMLLMVQEKTPREVPFMKGDTYELIPQLFIPRMLNSQKIASHEGTYRLNVQYGLQTRGEALTTTIAWGLLNEAYANFGYPGCALVGLILGAFYGWAARWSAGAPIMSARMMFTILVMCMALQTEFSSGVYIASLYQSTIALVGLTVLLMKRVRPH